MTLVAPPASYAKGYYTKALVWRGIYVLGNDEVPDEAVYRAAEIVFNSLANVDQAIIDKLVQYGARFAVIPYGTPITDLPDYSQLGPSWSNFRGLGATIYIPTSSSGEENLIPDHPNDSYLHLESIGLHEWMHAVEGIGLALANPALHNQFKAAYNNALLQGLWANTYADDTFEEYFAETAQAYFNDNPDVSPPDNTHNSINTRAELAAYDPTVFALHQSLFGASAWEVGDFYGSEGPDVMVGTSGGRVMFGNGGDDALTGGTGRDYLFGGAGADTLRGVSGKDDLDGGTGLDTAAFDGIAAKLDITLKGATVSRFKLDGRNDGTVVNIENVAGGTRNDRITGDGLGNHLLGNQGNDRLDGGKGNDKLSGGDGKDTLIGGRGADELSGGAGKDKFLFNTKLGAAHADVITDFRPNKDKLQLDDKIFKALTGDSVTTDQFYAKKGAVAAHDSNDRIIYNKATGALYYDADGKGGAKAIHFATLLTKPGGFDQGDILIV